MKITLYSKAGCHLCDEARMLLDELAVQVEFDLDEVDIRLDAECFERFRYRIPVLCINGREMLEGRFSAYDLAQAYAIARERAVDQA